MLAQEERLVGTYGDIQSASCTGITSFDRDDVLADLDNDHIIIRFSRSLEPLTPLLTIVKKRLQAGMLSKGFAEAKVQVKAPSTDKYLSITVAEGTRRRWTGIDLPEDDKVLPKAFIERYLTLPLVKETGLPVSKEKAAALAKIPMEERDNKIYSIPHLELGAWANFSAAYIDRLQKGLERHCQAFGFATCDVEVSCLAHDGPEATLKIRLQAGHERQVIAAIDIDDNKRNTDAEIMAFINQHGMAVGKYLTPSVLAATRAALRNSGRFLLPRITIKRSDAGPTLHISVHDHSKLPRLNEELNEIQKSALAMRHWLLHTFEQSGYAWRIQSNLTNGSQINVDLNLRGETLVYGQITDDELHKTYPFSLLVKDNRINWRTPARNLLMGNKDKYPLVMRLTLALSAQLPDEEDNVGNFSFNFGYTTSDQKRKHHSLLRMDLSADHAGLLTLFHSQDWSSTTKDGVCELNLTKSENRDHDAIVRYDTATGRPLYISFFNKEFDGHLTFTTYKADTFKDKVAFNIPAQQKVDWWEAVHILGSDILTTVLETMDSVSLENQDENHQQTRDMLNKAIPALPVAIMAFRSLHEKTQQFNKKQGEREKDRQFSLPNDPDYPMNMNNMFAIIAGELREHGGQAWHRDTWPMQLLQETQAVLARQEPDAIGKVVRILQSDRAGPIACLAAAYLMKLGNFRLYDRVAKLGLGQVNARGIYTDLAVLAGKHQTISSFIASIPHTDIFLALAPVEHRERLELLHIRCTAAKTAKEHEHASRYAAAMFAQLGLEEKLREMLKDLTKVPEKKF